MDEFIDIDKYRNEHEPDEHWKLRRAFLLQYWDTFDNEEILLRNAQLFINIEMLGCKYNNEIMKEIAELSNRVPEIRHYRKKGVNKVKRTLVGANSVIKSKYFKEDPKKVEKVEEITIEDKSEEKSEDEVDDVPEKMEVENWSEQDRREWNNESRDKEMKFQLMKFTKAQQMENLRALLSDVVVFEDMNGQIDFNKTSVGIKKIGKFEVTYDNQTGQFLYLFNGQIIGEGKADSKKAAKKIADITLEANLRNYCYQVRPKLAYYSPEDVVKREDGINKEMPHSSISDHLKEDNLGYRMLKSLGWKGGTSLGPKNEGIIDPITLSIKVGRKGLGNDNQTFEMNYFKNLLENFKQNQVEYDLIFSSEFTKEERAKIHQ